MSQRTIPTGIWAIANDVAPAQLDVWMELAGSAVAWTLRRPRCSELQALAMLRRMQTRAAFLAVHGRSDWALASGAHALIAGAQSLPWDALTLRLQRKEVAERAAHLLVGAAVHDNDQIDHAQSSLSAEFLVYGPVFDTPSKRDILSPRGLDGLSEVAAASSVPVVAIGGFERAEQVVAARQAGAHAVAVLRAVQAGRVTEMSAAWAELSRPE